MNLNETLSTCRAYLEGDIKKNGYLDGNLSTSHGFLPKKPPKELLPSPFSVWDEIVSQVPMLFFSNKTQEVLEKLPVLNADELPEEYLPRAATVISLLASAYWRHGINKFLSLRSNIENASLPESINNPWITICKRLHRDPLPYQSGTDLFINNFKLKPFINEYNLENIKIENIDVLVPSFENEPERVFYMSFVEIHAIISPIISDICNIEDLINEDSVTLEKKINAIVDILKNIEKMINRATKALLKISPNKKSKTYCDPVLWAKTVGVFAIPPSNYIQGGTSGTSIPFVHVLDALIGRHKYKSYYGDYVKNHGFKLLDIKTKGFVLRVVNLGLPNWISSIPNDVVGYTDIVDSFNQIIEQYIGKNGFLDKHISKVFNYLGVATLVGRNQSTSGHERYMSSETWRQVCDNLKISQHERPGSNSLKRIDKETLVDHEEQLPVYGKDIVARHYKINDGWIIIDDSVYDVTEFIKVHPGGKEILSSYLGRDSTKVFFQISAHSNKKLKSMLNKMKIGKTTSYIENKAFIKFENLLYYLQKVHSILSIENRGANDSKMEFIYLLHTHRLFIDDQLNTIKEFLSIKKSYFKENGLEKIAKNEDINKLSDRRLFQLSHQAKLIVNRDIKLVQCLIDDILENEPLTKDHLVNIIMCFQREIEKSRYPHSCKVTMDIDDQ